VTERPESAQGVGRDEGDGGTLLAKGIGILAVVTGLTHGASADCHIFSPLIEPLIFFSSRMQRYSPSASST